MNEYNNNETNDNVMDIPVVPVAEEIQNPGPSIVEPDTPTTEQETPESADIMQEQSFQMNNLANSEAQTLATDSQTIGDLNINNESPVEVNQISPNPLPNESDVNVIPETMDLNYGVIPPNNSETVLKQDSNKKSSKIIVGIVIALLVVFLLVVGFLAYKFYFAVDPVKTVTTKIREFGKEADEMYKNSSEMTLLKNNDKLGYDGKISAAMDLAGEKYSADLGYNMTLLKNENKVSANIYANLNETNLLDLDATIFKSALFVNVLEEGHNFRINTDATEFFTDLENEINNMANTKIFETYANYLANAIEKNVSKKDFEMSTAKTDINGKKVLSNKYSLNLTNETINNILVNFLESLKNDKDLGAKLETLNTNDLQTDFKNLKLNIYASLKGVIKVEVISTEDNVAGKITYSKVDDEHKVFIINDGSTDLVAMDIYDKSDKTTIDITADFEGTKLTANLEMTEQGNIKGNIDVAGMTAVLESKINTTEEDKKIATDMTLKLTISMPDTLPSDIIIDISSNSSAKADDNLTVQMPSGAINIETTEGQSLFEGEFSQTGLFSLLEQFLASDDLMNSAGENADEFNSYDNYTNLNNTI